MSNLSDKCLDIILITYNRADKLQKTLEALFAPESPVRNFEITILDNNSQDDTEDVVRNFQRKFHRLHYIKNKYNIGGNANIVRAFELAKKDYIWILADNDEFCWDSWQEVEDGIREEKDAIVVSDYECPKENIAQLFIQTTFLPGVIYKVANIDDTVVGNMEFNISNMFPHLALSAKLINEDKQISIISRAVVIPGDNRDEKTGEYTFVRGYKYRSLHPLMKNMNWLTGYANSLYMIHDKTLRNYIISHNMFYYCPLNSANVFYYNEKEAGGSLYNLLSIFAVLGIFDKLRFIINFVLYYTLYRILYIYSYYKREKAEDCFIKEFRVRLFYYINTRLFRIKIRGNS